MPLHVAFVTDRSYLPWCATAVRSCVDANAPGTVHVHVVHDGSLTTADVDQLDGMVADGLLSVHRVDLHEVQHLPALDRFGHIVWLRFLLPDLLDDVDRVLYLDADTLVTDDLVALRDLDMHGAPVAAVANVMLAGDEARLREMGIEPTEFLNSGVLLLDLVRLRAERFTDQIVAATAALGDRIRWPDQDVLNHVVAGRWQRLHPRYNAQNSFFEWPDRAAPVVGAEALAEAVAAPAIVHFEGPYLCKPWHVLCAHPWRDRYRAVLARTPWAGVGLEDDGPLTRAIGRLPAAWQLPVYEQVVRHRQGLRVSLRGALRRRRAAVRRSA